MKFFNSRLTKKQLRRNICVFAKKAGVKKVIFSATGKKVCGTYHAGRKHIYVNLNLTKQQMLRAFFHEMGHHTAVLKNKWKTYHFNLVSEMEAVKVFNIENQIDKIGNGLWFEHVNSKRWGRYKYFYPKQDLTYFLANI